MHNYKPEIIEESMVFIDKLIYENKCPPSLTCIHVAAFAISNLVAVYKTQNKKAPKELIKFLEKTYPKLLEDNKDFIEKQYLSLNAEGSA